MSAGKAGRVRNPAKTRPASLSWTPIEPLADPDSTSARLAEAEDTLRAIGAGEVDAFVLPDDEQKSRVFTISTTDRPYRIFVENMREGAATLSSEGIVLFANRRLAELLSRPREGIVGTRLETFMTGGLAGVLAVERVGELGGREPVECELVDADGLIVPVLVGTAPLEVDGDHMTCMTFTDLTIQTAQARKIEAQVATLQAAQAALVVQATHDSLTGLPNRMLLVDRIEMSLAQARRSERVTAVFFIDIDRFKHVNDTLGHAAGDAVLRRVADLLVAVLRPMDTVSRLGGDEFVVVAPELHDEAHAVRVGVRLVEEIGRRRSGVRDGETITASVGVAVASAGAGSAEKLLSEADAAMYKAKSRGGARVESFDEDLGRQVARRAQSTRTLRTALNEQRVTPHYQPIIDLASGEVCGFEALARITDESGGLLSPAAFIADAEDSGLIVPLGDEMLSAACSEACGWRSSARGGAELSIAVNLSARQFDAGDLAAAVDTHLERSGLAPARLHLELTETALMDLHPSILQQLGDLRDLGVEVGLDDFGTGYASLTHLRRLPVTFVKIDQTFVAGIGSGRADDRIVSAVIDLAANLGLRTIAEGVETQAQLDRLRAMGCDEAQGYFFARPAGPENVGSVLAHLPW